MDDKPGVAGLPAGSEDDKQLTLAYQAGDKGAYQTIHDRYAPRVHSVCRRMLGNPQDAQEAAQETFLRVYQALGRFNGRYQLGAWITRIATNVCLDHLRARARRPVDAAAPDEIELALEPLPQSDDPEFVAIRNAEGRRVRRVLAGLPPLHRAAIVLRDFEGLSYQEVAVALGISDCQVKALIHRARQSFKRSWTPLSVLLPTRLFQRVRELDAFNREHILQVAVPQATPAASSCAAAFASCGHYVAERVMPIVAAAIVGAGAVAVPADAPRPHTEATSEVIHAAAEPAPLTLEKKPVRPSTEATPHKPDHLDDPVPADGAAGDEGTDEVTEPQPEPSPSATPTQSASPPEGSSSPPAEETVKKEDGGAAPVFAPAVGFDRGEPLTGSAPKSNSAAVDCSALRFEQRMQADFVDGPSRYASYMHLVGSGVSASMEINIWKDEFVVSYGARDARASLSVEAGKLKLAMSGTYFDRGNAARAGLPTSGSFSAALEVDCATSAVITESVVLSTR